MALRVIKELKSLNGVCVRIFDFISFRSSCCGPDSALKLQKQCDVFLIHGVFIALSERDTTDKTKSIELVTLQISMCVP